MQQMLRELSQMLLSNDQVNINFVHFLVQHQLTFEDNELQLLFFEF